MVLGVVEHHDAAHVLDEGEGEQGQRTAAREPPAEIKLLRGFLAIGGVRFAQHDPSGKDVGVETLAVPGDESVALGEKQGDGVIESGIAAGSPPRLRWTEG